MTAIARPIALPLGIFLLMLAVSALGFLIRPQDIQKRSLDPSVDLERTVPKAFGSWQIVPDAIGIVANPETQALLDKLYSQILVRTYVNDKGYRIMMSIVYGEDQRGGLQAHRPEVCYPAQGFELVSERAATLSTPGGGIAVKRLETRQGNRVEPVTYWFSLGGKAVSNNFQRRMAEVSLAFVGKIPDGYLVRVSSIDAASESAFAQQQAFVGELLAALPETMRAKLSGL